MKNARPPCFAVLIMLTLVATGWIAGAAAGALAAANVAAGRVQPNIDRLPLHFVENAGQVDPQVRYYVQGFDKTFYFTAQGVTLALAERSGPRDAARLASAAADPAPLHAGAEQRRVALKLDFIGANANATPRAEEPAPALFSYFRGAPSEWRTGLNSYRKLVYRDLWPGIDLIYSGTVQRLKYMLVVKPGADPELIKLAYRGADAVKINDDGRLEVGTALGGFYDDKPTAYQPMNGEEAEVSVAYAFDPASEPKVFTYGFRLGAYDSSLPLIIDPAILVYAGFVGGSGTDRGNAIAVDAAGGAYVTGETSSLANFPVKAGPDLTQNGGTDAFIAKVAPDGRSLLYAGFIGGSGTDRGMGIAVDGASNAYVVGETSSGVNFPASIGPDLIHNGAVDAFVVKVNASGTALLYAGFIGGVNDDRGKAIALEQDCPSNCAAYITGDTSSPQTSFPETAGFDPTYNGDFDAFVAKVNAAGTALEYAGYVGGSGTDRGNGIAVDGDGSAYVTGETDSLGNSFPDGNGFSGLPGLDQIENGAVDAFIIKVDPPGTALLYASYIGGLLDDRGNAIAIEPGCASNCAAYITGTTSSDQTTFPVDVGPDLIHNGGADAFVAKLAANGLSLVYAGYIGGFDDDRGNGIAVDSANGAHVTGETTSAQATFPDTLGPDLTHNGGIDAFVAQVNAAGNGLIYAGFIGGLGDDRGKGIALDSAGDVYVAGETGSDVASFPEKIGPDTTHNGGIDTFVAKICVTACADLRITQTDAPDPARAGEDVTYTITVTNDGPDTATNVALSVILPSTVTFVSSVPAAPGCVFTVTLDCDLGDLNSAVSAVVTLVLATTAKGTFRVTAIASADQTDPDSRNNEETETTKATFGNLVLRQLDTLKAALPGAAITIDDTTVNSGIVDAQASITRFYFSTDARLDGGDALLGSRMIPALVAKAGDSGSTMVTIPGGAALGRYFIIGVADADNSVSETAERNRRNRALQITRPDLGVATLRAPASAAAGGMITIDDTTVNQSPLDAGASTTRFFLSSDAVFDAGDTPLMNNERAVPALPAKGKHAGSTTATIPGGTAPGKYFLIVKADADAAVMEVDETNNTRAKRITVTP